MEEGQLPQQPSRTELPPNGVRPEIQIPQPGPELPSGGPAVEMPPPGSYLERPQPNGAPPIKEIPNQFTESEQAPEMKNLVAEYTERRKQMEAEKDAIMAAAEAAFKQGDIRTATEALQINRSGELAKMIDSLDPQMPSYAKAFKAVSMWLDSKFTKKV